MRAIDLALQVREAFYELSNRKREAMLSGKVDALGDLLDLAWNVTPKIFPLVELQTVNQLTALAEDLPELVTREPEDIQGLRFDYDILPLTPLRLLHANVVDLAVRFGKDELAHLPRIGRLSGDSRHVYNRMQKRYVVGGFVSQGGVSIEEILREVFGKPDRRLENKARQILHQLIEEGLAERGISSDEVYHLSLLERSALIERYHLAVRWPKPYPPFDEAADVQRALLAIEQKQEHQEKRYDAIM
ncbi:MAG: hypothetical protein H0U76_22345 [Ktedonobacteraceae bacterium]|nr:hypothetical protein [Ktedonobacteraceae bacterium]